MEGEATRLQIHFEFAEDENYETPEKVIKFVKNVFEEYDLSPKRENYNIYSRYFPDSDTNMTAVDEIEMRFIDMFSEDNIKRYTNSGEHYGIPPGTYITTITINSLPEDLKAESSVSTEQEEARERENDEDRFGDKHSIDESERVTESERQKKRDQERTEDEVGQCPDCGSTNVVEEQEETFCSDCGLLLRP